MLYAHKTQLVEGHASTQQLPKKFGIVQVDTYATMSLICELRRLGMH
jgi:hypothetical protein